MWINQKRAVSVEPQDSVQELQVRLCRVSNFYKQMGGFGQSFLGVLKLLIY